MEKYKYTTEKDKYFLLKMDQKGLKNYKIKIRAWNKLSSNYKS